MTKEDIKAKIEFEYNTIARMIFMLNGRNPHTSRYSCGYHPHKMEIFSHDTKGMGVPHFKREIFFNDVNLSYQCIQFRFNGEHWMSINTETGKFGYGDEERAKLIFGKYVTASDVLLHTKSALREILEEYTKQIKEVLDKPWIGV